MDKALKHAILVLGLAVIVGTPERALAAEPDWKAVEAGAGQVGTDCSRAASSVSACRVPISPSP